MIGSHLRRTGLIVLALLPALATAAPRSRGKKGGKKAAPTASAPAPEPAEPAPSTPPQAAPAEPAKAPTPPPVTAPATPAAGDAIPVTSDEPDVDPLRQEYLSLRDELFKSRARASTVASQLYSTRMQVKLTYTTARHYNPAKAWIRLDGATVFEDATGMIAGDDGVRFDGYVAPGRHLVTFRVEATGKDDDSFTSVTETQIVVKAVAGKDLVVAAKAKDGGDIAYEWKRKERGSYGLGIDVAVKTVPRADGGAAAPTPAAKGTSK